MRVMIVGQKWLAEQVLQLCLRSGYAVAAIVAPSVEDRLYRAGETAEVPSLVVRTRLESESVPPGVDLIVAAHCHCFIAPGALAPVRLGAIGYHPSLLPRHRGGDAIRWALHMREAITGGTVYWMDDRADCGPIAAQDWCHIRPGDTPEELWRRELAPMGLRLIEKVLIDVGAGIFKKVEQDKSLATWEPSFTRPEFSRAT